jgi:hypothetical protein
MRICTHDDARRALLEIVRNVREDRDDCHTQVTSCRVFPAIRLFCLRFAKCALDAAVARCFDDRCSFNSIGGEGRRVAQGTQGKKTRKVSCDECYFRCNLLCALDLAEPCATFRPNEAQLRPPKQLHFVFRQERRSRAAWAFPSAQEQAALHA